MTSAIDELVTALHALAANHPETVQLFGGFDGGELDLFPVPVPEPERTLLRQIGGFLVEESDYFGPGNEHRHLGEPPEWTDALGGDWDTGPKGSALQFYVLKGCGDQYFVDVDRDTGHWGPILGSCPESHDDVVAYQARSLVEWWTALVAGLTATLREPQDPESHRADEGVLSSRNPLLATALAPWYQRCPHAMAVPYRELTAGLPPQEHRYFTDLPDDALAIDLSTLTPPTTLDVCVCEETERRGNGRYLLITSLER